MNTLQASSDAPPAPTNNPTLKTYLDTREAAEFLGVSVNFLEGARCSRSGPPYYKLSRRVRYLREDLHRWMAERRYDNN